MVRSVLRSSQLDPDSGSAGERGPLIDGLPIEERCLLSLWLSWRVVSSTYSSWAERSRSAPDVSCGKVEHYILLKEDSNPLNVDGFLASAYFKEATSDESPPSEKSCKGTKFLRFLHQLTDNLVIKWDTAVKDGRLYIQLPKEPLQPFSRDSLVELLDVAEDMCSQAIICFPKNHQNGAGLIRTFKFIGFEMLPPAHKWTPDASDSFFMAYDID